MKVKEILDSAFDDLNDIEDILLDTDNKPHEEGEYILFAPLKEPVRLASENEQDQYLKHFENRFKNLTINIRGDFIWSHFL